MKKKKECKGFYWHKKACKYCAQIQIKGKIIHLGLYDSPEEAHNAYVNAKGRVRNNKKVQPIAREKRTLMKDKQFDRHWYILLKPGDDKIRALISAFSSEHIKRKADLENTHVTIQKAKRWHVARVFSGSAVFKDYARKIPVVGFSRAEEAYCHEDVESPVPNEFHMRMDDEKILVKILS